MWVVPGATQRYIINKSAGVRDKTLGLILHVQVGNGELTGWFNNPGARASSAWQALKSTPNPIQFGDPDADKFWTQGAGNADYGAVESEGWPDEPLNENQIEAIARIYAAGHVNEGWPFQLAEKPGDRGLGWHGMGGTAWGNHPDCPGRIRRGQRQQILDRAKQIAGVVSTPTKESDDLSAAEVKEIKDHVSKILTGTYTVGDKEFPGLAKVDIETQRRVTVLSAQVQTLATAVAALAQSKGADADAITKAVVDKISQLELAVSVKTGA